MIRASAVSLGLISYVLTSMVAPAAATSFFDTFSDGNDDEWTHAPRIVSGTPALYSVNSGRYQMASSGIVLESDTAVVSVYTQSAISSGFSDGVLSASVIVDTVNTGAGLIFRADDSLESSYAFTVNNALNALFILALGPERSFCSPVYCYDVLGQSPFLVSESTEYRIQASAYGSELTFTAWNALDPMPSAPQVTAFDTVITQGAIAIGVGMYLPYPLGSTTPISGSFDNVSFVPEPTTALLLACGLAGLAAAGRRRQ